MRRQMHSFSVQMQHVVAPRPCIAAAPAACRHPAARRRPSLAPLRAVGADERASDSGRTDPSDAGPRITTDESGSRGRPDVPKGMRLERVERLGQEAWHGVAQVDRGGDPPDWGRIALLVGGDAAALLAFAAVGRGSHAELDGIAGVLDTAWPFLLGWYIAAASTGAYGRAALGSEKGAAAATAAKAWIIGTPLALVLRSLARGYPPPLPFAIVSMVVTGVVTVGWRTALAALSPQADSAQRGAGRRRDRSGGPLEFLSLLSGLTKRW